MSSSQEVEKLVNCPNCGGIVAKEVRGYVKAQIRCPHCQYNIELTTKVVARLN